MRVSQLHLPGHWTIEIRSHHVNWRTTIITIAIAITTTISISITITLTLTLTLTIIIIICHIPRLRGIRFRLRRVS